MFIKLVSLIYLYNYVQGIGLIFRKQRQLQFHPFVKELALIEETDIKISRQLPFWEYYSLIFPRRSICAIRSVKSSQKDPHLSHKFVFLVLCCVYLQLDSEPQKWTAAEDLTHQIQRPKKETHTSSSF